jgi:hypothetical protein
MDKNNNVKNLFDFEADNDDDIFSKKNGETNIFDSNYNNNDKDDIFG